jgi:prefoldin subunit 5
MPESLLEKEAQEKQEQGGEIGKEDLGSFQVDSFLSSQNASLFERMSQKGKSILNKIYQGLDKIPIVSRVIGKLEIAYSQFWIDRHQKKASKIREKLNGLDVQIDALGQSEEEISSLVQKLREQNLPGSESLLTKIQEVQEKKQKLLNRRELYQSRLQQSAERIEAYSKRRDTVADRFIARYQEKLKPIEDEVSRLENQKAKLDFEISLVEAKHELLDARIRNIEQTKEEIKDSLRKAGMSDKEIERYPAIRQLEEVIRSTQEEMKKSRELLATRKAKIESDIAKAQDRANSYRNKRSEFERIKEGKRKDLDEKGKTNETSETPKPDSERKEPNFEEFRFNLFIRGWNEFIRLNPDLKFDQIGQDFIDSMENVGLLDLENKLIPAKIFKDILQKYYKYRNRFLNERAFNDSFDEFQRQMKEGRIRPRQEK